MASMVSMVLADTNTLEEEIYQEIMGEALESFQKRDEDSAKKGCIPANSGGKKCIFPYTDGGKTCNGPGCCNLDGDAKGAWCSTQVDDNGVHVPGNYAYCKGRCRCGILKIARTPRYLIPFKLHKTLKIEGSEI